MASRDKIEDNLFALYDCYAQYKLLFKFWQENKKVRQKNEIKERLEYLKVNKCNGRNEKETLEWILNADT